MADQDQPDRHGIDADEALRAIEGEEPSAQGLIDFLGGLGGGLGASGPAGDGWGGIETTAQALRKQRAEAVKAMKAEANVFRDCFSTPEGRKCLALMVEQTVYSEPYPAEAMLPMDAITPLVLVHDAQARFVRAIIQAVHAADNQEASGNE